MLRPTPILALLAVAGAAVADHDAGCAWTAADPSTYNVLDVLGTRYYVEERNVPEPFRTVPPVPRSGFLFGDGTYAYAEGNGVPGLQRGDCLSSITIPFPMAFEADAKATACGGCFPLEDPCLTGGRDWIADENCGHGPDTGQAWY